MNLVGFIGLSTQSTEFFDVTVTSSAHHDGSTEASPGYVALEHGCLVLRQEVTPQDNPQNIISKETQFWISTITSTSLTSIFFLVGVPGNILNAAVFYRQGLRERVNFCVFCLAIVDLVVISINFLVLAEVSYRFFVGSSNVIIRYFVGFTGFTWVSMFLNTVIAAERCFCVVSPLRAQRMLSTRTVAVVIIPVSVIILTGMLVIVGPKHTEVCVMDPQTNKTSYIVYVTEYYMKNEEILDIIDIFVYATALPCIFFVVSIVTTIITATKLRSAVKWRQQTSSATGSSESMMAVTRMLVGTSVLFIVCLTPLLVVQVAMFMVPELQFGALYHNLTTALWGVVLLFLCGNSSLNFFIYYKMGSRFRQTLKELLSCGKDKH